MKCLIGCILLFCAVQLSAQEYVEDTTGFHLKYLSLCNSQGHPANLVHIYEFERRREVVGYRLIESDTLFAVKDSSYSVFHCQRCRRFWQKYDNGKSYIDSVLIKEGQVRDEEPAMPPGP